MPMPIILVDEHIGGAYAEHSTQSFKEVSFGSTHQDGHHQRKPKR